MKTHVLLLLLISVVSLQGMEVEEKKVVDVANKQLEISYGYSTRANNKKFFVNSNDMPRQEDEVYAKNGNKFFGIYDGHGNSAVVDTVQSLIYEKRYVGNRVAVYLRNSLPDIFTKQKGSSKEKFIAAYEVAEKSILALPGDEDSVQGSTATNAFIDEKNILHVVWVGDSSLKLVKKDGTWVDITKDHRAKDNDEEKKRIIEAGGQIVNGRLAGLEVTRSFGDKSTKDSLGGKGLIAIPDYASIQLVEDDDFVIMATDGVWDFVPPKDVVLTVKQAMEKNSKKLSQEYFDPQLNDGGQEGKSDEGNLDLVSRAVCQAAQNNKSGDNISTVIIKLNWKDKPEKMAKLHELKKGPENNDKKWWNLLPSFITENPLPWMSGGIASLALIGGLAYYLKYLQ